MKSLTEYINEAGSSWAYANAGFGGINIMSDTDKLIRQLMSKLDLKMSNTLSYREKITRAVQDLIFGITAALKKGKLWKNDVPFEFKMRFDKAVKTHGVDPEDLLNMAIGFSKFDRDTVEIFKKEGIDPENISEYVK